jgi:hypothetical protein
MSPTDDPPWRTDWVLIVDTTARRINRRKRPTVQPSTAV